LWGEPGYDSLLSEPLWPFPNEDVVKNTMGAWTYMNNGKRGFCADGNGLYGGPITLTSYIWEYLGNPCPPEICAYGPARTETAAPAEPEMALNVSPNPFNPATTISFDLSAGSPLRPGEGDGVRLSIYNAAGQNIATLINHPLAPGKYTLTWNATGLPSGLYVARLTAGTAQLTRKILLLK
jgi:hypothetical protein